MTSRQRINAALNHRQPDRTPIFEYVLLSPVADKLLGRTYAADPSNWAALLEEKGWEDAVLQMAVDQLDLACLLGHDMMYVLPNPPPTETEATSPPPEESPCDDPVEIVRKRNERREQSPQRLQDKSFLVYSLLHKEMQRRGVDLPILAPAYAHGVWADVDLMQTMLLEPEVAHKHFALATRGALEHIEKYISLGIDQIGIGGDFAGNSPLISPQAYRKFIVPEVRTLARRIRTAGLWSTNTSDGNLWSVIDDFLYGCEVDGYLEIDMHAGMDMGKLKASYGDRITFYGNLDCGNILSFGSPEDIRRHTIDCLEAGMGNGGHILCVSNAITESVPLQNYLAVVDAYRDMFSLTRLQLDRKLDVEKC